ncbi:MAG: hypothetical protein JWQ35_956 [Bacteriovoracaceae bacterium]|nr:hypothetical protein [Bacteriovoracaceae bacterium]
MGKVCRVFVFSISMMSLSSHLFATYLEKMRPVSVANESSFKKTRSRRLLVGFGCAALMGALGGNFLARYLNLTGKDVFVGAFFGTAISLVTMQFGFEYWGFLKNKIKDIPAANSPAGEIKRMVRVLEEISKGHHQTKNLKELYADLLVYGDGLKISYADFLNLLHEWNQSDESASIVPMNPRIAFLEYAIQSN